MRGSSNLIDEIVWILQKYEFRIIPRQKDKFNFDKLMNHFFYYLHVIFMMWVGEENLPQHLDNAMGEPLNLYNFAFS